MSLEDFDLAQYDLTKEEDVENLGRDFNRWLMDYLIPLVHAMPEVNRWRFFTPFLTGTATVMRATCGAETALRVLDVLKDFHEARVKTQTGKLNS